MGAQRDAGLVQVTTTGFDRTSLRTGVIHTGLSDANVKDFIAEVSLVGTDRALFTSRYGNAPMIGVRCAP